MLSRLGLAAQERIFSAEGQLMFIGAQCSENRMTAACCTLCTMTTAHLILRMGHGILLTWHPSETAALFGRAAFRHRCRAYTAVRKGLGEQQRAQVDCGHWNNWDVFESLCLDALMMSRLV